MRNMRRQTECHACPGDRYEPARGRVHVDVIFGAGSAQGWGEEGERDAQ